MKKPAPQSKLAVGYVRVSTLKQAEVSPEAQLDAIRGYCAMRKIALVEVLSDIGVSGGTPLAERPGGAKVLAAVAAKKVDAVVALKLDRLFRNARDCLAVVEDWNKGGIALHLVDMGGQTIDTSTAMGEFFLTVMAGAAAMERNLTKERTIATLDYKRQQGERLGMIPYGYRVNEDKLHLEPDPHEQKIVQAIVEARARGFTAQSIVDTYNANGVKARGKRWHVTTIRRILRRVAAMVNAAEEK